MYQRKWFHRKRFLGGKPRWRPITMEQLKKDLAQWNYPQAIRHLIKRIDAGEFINTPDAEYRLKDWDD